MVTIKEMQFMHLPGYFHLFHCEFWALGLSLLQQIQKCGEHTTILDDKIKRHALLWSAFRYEQAFKDIIKTSPKMQNWSRNK